MSQPDTDHAAAPAADNARALFEAANRVAEHHRKAWLPQAPVEREQGGSRSAG